MQYQSKTHLQSLPSEADAEDIHDLAKVVVDLLNGGQMVLEALVARKVAKQIKRDTTTQHVTWSDTELVSYTAYKTT